MKFSKFSGLFSFFIILFFCTGLFAAAVSQIKLTDGSILTGKIMSFKNGVYTLQTNTMGTVNVTESEIISIQPKSAPLSPSSVQEQIFILQALMANDKETMDKIYSLKDDPDFEKALQDPDIIKAVKSGDINALLSNPKFLKLLESQTVKEIKRDLGK